MSIGTSTLVEARKSNRSSAEQLHQKPQLVLQASSNYIEVGDNYNAFRRKRTEMHVWVITGVETGRGKKRFLYVQRRRFVHRSTQEEDLNACLGYHWRRNWSG